MAILLFLATLQAGPREETVSVPDTKVNFRMVQVPAGKTVKSFWMGKHEVIWDDFKIFEGDQNKLAIERMKVDGIVRPSKGRSFFGQVQCPEDFLNESGRPVICVRVHGAFAYTDWLSKKTGRRFRLPTEAEWEHASRAGSEKDGPDALDDLAWHAGNSGGRTHKVGEKKPNAFGLHDILGNVWEYCLDSDEPPAYAPVVRGGCWKSEANTLRFGTRSPILPEWYGADPNRPRSAWWLTTEFTQGFRVVCVDDGVDWKERDAYLAQIEIKVKGFSEVSIKDRPALGAWVMRVEGEVTNNGARTIEELDLTVAYLDMEGKLHFLDVSGGDKPDRPTYGRCHPVMVAAGKGSESKPLRPGETRAWTAEFPQSGDVDGDEVNKKAFGARVEAIRFAP